MANSVDPDQTVWSGSALFAYIILSETLKFEILGHLLYIASPGAYVCMLGKYGTVFYLNIWTDRPE